ncbi:nitrogenase iron-molybdenum cofactor biosynthesis protein NifE [Frankia sp. AgKG'84/4]|uniref:nitrogenase iron-molybdenum cofactor biosynthesis protein NifE n=1 Tax=Frankia sp. AgKG'84/4 TaxID=573490 RepID=UPI00200D070E|nr:nitrogenase iron-molybdenum cofactor biosynthesis protein NifE [Frankia sp. AgKG'84/4]MCL9793312.1 nitrogenase iron-molybdenum cofactor biosynthesis protein NifE [Frankia sp. AgKG'84/4]
MSAADRAALFTETSCDTNSTKSEKQRKAGCPKPKPGGTSGGCTFDGAMITLVPIVDSAHIVHGPIACAGNSWDGRGSLSSGPTLYRRGFTTDMTENDVVLGGEQRLFDTILDVVERFAPPAVFVYTTCVTAMIGDDLDAVCTAATAQTGVPVIPVDAPGFVGNKNLGNKIAGQALLDHVIGTVEPADVGRFDVNLIGEYNIAGELWDVLPLLGRLGIRVRACISGDARYHDVAGAHRAKASMVVCSRALLGLARGLDERYGIPWFEGSFYGTRAMGDTLRGFARLLGDDELTRRTEELIAAEEAATEKALAPYRERLTGRRAVLYTGGVKSWSIVSALQDLGIEVVGSGTTKSSDGDVEKIRELLGDAKMIKEGSPRELLRVAAETGADILVAGGRNQYTAIKGRLPFLDINQERHIPYAGYTGMVEFARRLDLAISSPVWEQVRRPAPWDTPVLVDLAEVA